MRDFGNEIWKRAPIQEIGKGEIGNNMGTESGTIRKIKKIFEIGKEEFGNL